MIAFAARLSERYANRGSRVEKHPRFSYRSTIVEQINFYFSPRRWKKYLSLLYTADLDLCPLTKYSLSCMLFVVPICIFMFQFHFSFSRWKKFLRFETVASVSHVLYETFRNAISAVTRCNRRDYIGNIWILSPFISVLFILFRKIRVRVDTGVVRLRVRLHLFGRLLA